MLDETAPIPAWPMPGTGDTLVCGRKMTIPPENYYRAEYKGHEIHFCTEFCLETFRADPERFYIAHSRRKDPREPSS